MPGAPSTPEPSDPLPVLILGIAGLVFLPAAALAWMLGNRYLRRCGVHGVDADPSARLGRTMGMVGTFVWVPALIAICAAGAMTTALAG